MTKTKPVQFYNVQFYTTKEVAQELGVSMERVWYLAEKRKLGHVYGRQMLFTQVELENLRVRGKNYAKKEEQK